MKPNLKPNLKPNQELVAIGLLLNAIDCIKQGAELMSLEQLSQWQDMRCFLERVCEYLERPLER